MARTWARDTRSLADAVVTLAQRLSWQETARLYGLDWKSVASLVRRAAGYGLAGRRRGHHYLSVVCDLERRVLVWVGENRTVETLAKFFTELGPRCCRTIRMVCMDMWAAHAKAVRKHLPHAQILFDRFHVVQHLSRAVDEVRHNQMRLPTRRERTPFHAIRCLLLNSPQEPLPD